MTGLLRRVESLSREEQDAIASQIIETLDDDEAWARRFRDNPAPSRSLAREALDGHRRGETRSLDELPELPVIPSAHPGTMDLAQFDFDDLLA